MKITLKLRVFCTAIVTLLIWGHLAWDYFHGGVPTHHLLHDGDLPGISNWWGAIVLPVFTWFLLIRIQKRNDGNENSHSSENLGAIVRRFVAALLVGISIAVCFSLGIEVIEYIMGALFVLSFLLPLYKSEYFLGFVLASTFTFGAIIPIGFGIIIVLVFFLFYKVSRAIIGFVRPKKKQV